MNKNPGSTLFLDQPQLKIFWPDGRTQSMYIKNPVLKIGRATDCDLVIPADFSSISRYHLEIILDGQQYRIVDQGSVNGVFLNGEAVGEEILSDQDEIKIGLAEYQQEIRLVFEWDTGQAIALASGSEIDYSKESQFESETPESSAYFSLRWPDGKSSYFAILKPSITVGRSDQADLRIPEHFRFVSAKHFEVTLEGQQFAIRDLGSTNGTLLNNRKLATDSKAPLFDGAIVRLGDERFGVSISLTFTSPVQQVAPAEGYTVSAPTFKVGELPEITIGRQPGNSIVLDAPDVSRRHAKITMINGKSVLEDLGSRNGTYVNETLVQRSELREGDLIRIGSYLLSFQDGQVTPYQSNGMRVDVSELSKDVDDRRGKRRILDKISLSVLPREFVAIVGGSGAGKTTLLNALVGIRPGDGQVELNGHNFYEEYEHYRSQLGYVPQNDILHTSLTVEKALEFTARLRLPNSINSEERSRRIAAVLETVSMNTDVIRGTRISNLSGGQRKRVSIAAELLADPKLIYLDEATSGLDPGLEKKLMHTLRGMADEGRTVMLITHATGNIVQTDHVAFISQGKLVFFGPSQAALDFFEVDDFADIYEKIERSGEKWRQIYEEEKPENYLQYVGDRLRTAKSLPKRELPKVRFGLAEFFRQFLVLTQRSIKVLFSEPVTLLLMLLLLPLTGVLQLIIGSEDILTGNLNILADPAGAAASLKESYVPFARMNTFVFVMGLEAVLTGLFVPSNDLVKERSIYLRERMVNLRVMPYLLSKGAVYSVFVVVQVFLYLVILSLGINYPEDGLFFPGTLELFITLYLTMMAGIAFGLIISAVSRSTEMAIYLLTMMLFFQFFFSGTVFDLRDNSFEALSYLTTTRWSLNALGVTIDMEDIVESTILCSELPEDPFNPAGPSKTVCSHYPDAVESMMLTYEDDRLLLSWGVLAGMTVLFFGFTAVLLEKTKAF